MRGVSLQFDGLRLRGFSRAGDETWFRVDPPGLGLDVGRGAYPLIGSRWLFLSHGHLDHSLGLPWLLSQRNLQGLEAPTVFCPRAAIADLTEFVRAASRLEGEPMEFEPVGLESGDSRQLTDNLRLEVFRTDHVVSSLGCHLFRSVERLRPDLIGRSTEEVAAIKRSGEQVAEATEELWLSYCGDTGPAVFDSEPRVFEAQILVIECTFSGAATGDLGARFGHLHLNDFVEHAARFENEAIVLAHLSRRHRVAEFRREVGRQLPGLYPRIKFVPGAIEAPTGGRS